MRIYAFRDMILSRVEGVANEMAAQGFSPQNIFKEGTRIYVLFSKWEDEDEVEKSELDELYEVLDDVSGRLYSVEQALKLFSPSSLEEVPADTE